MLVSIFSCKEENHRTQTQGASSKDTTSPAFSANDQNPLPDQIKQFNDIKMRLCEEAATLNSEVIKKIATALECAKQYDGEHNNILTIIDYSLPSSEKTLLGF
ncbi:hypothetical protein [Candidatus Coxiella mudrowiae]|uniref:hypothetical protein n=1 Tax=Candidatus Coxiella mudrowiae TaxID=2054173 RepID=UPI000C282E7B|nr:hypothetical protein [Candidatus Coxiella mudrowiae]